MFALGGNPAVISLIEQNVDLDCLLDLDAFPAEFRSSNPQLEAFMTIQKCEQLVEYITEVGPQDNLSRSYKYPMVVAQILSIDNRHMQEIVIKEESVVVQQDIIEQRWVQKQVDECDSDYYSDSSKSDRSRRSVEEYCKKQGQVKEQQNIPPYINLQNRSSVESQGGSNSSNASITSEDFPFVEDKAKVVKIKTMFKRKIERKIPPLLDLICMYFKKPLNHTLAGYICKVLESYLKRNSQRIVRQFFKRTDKEEQLFCNSLLKHLQSQSVCDFCINLILTNDNEAEDARKQLVLKILNKIVIADCRNQTDLFQITNYVSVITEIVYKTNLTEPSWERKLVYVIFQHPSLIQIAQKCFSAHISTKQRQILLSLFLKFLKKLFQTPISKNSQKNKYMIKQQLSQDQKQTIKKIVQILQPCFKGFIQKSFDPLQNEQQKYSSGLFLKQLQIINVLVKQNLFYVRTQLGNYNEIFRLLVSVCKRFPNNNLLHNQIFQLFKFVTHNIEEFDTLWNKIFESNFFVSFCIETLGKRQVMFRGQCIYLCQAIKCSKSETIRKFKLLNEPKWSRIQEFLHFDSQQMNKSLGGFAKKQFMSEVMFERQAILDKFTPFLKGEIMKENSFEDDDDEELEDLTSSRNSSNQWNDWNQFTNYSADEVND